MHAAPRSADLPRVFGYGSLVNGATHAWPDLAPARLTGWRRTWCRAAGRRVSLLTVRRAPGAAMDGAAARVPDADWRALDAREASYAREDCAAGLVPAGRGAAWLYAVPGAYVAAVPDGPPILLSYLDTVIAGFASLHGPDGPARFFDETGGWEAPVADDRRAPLYPRHRAVGAALEGLVDALLRKRRAQIVPAASVQG